MAARSFTCSLSFILGLAAATPLRGAGVTLVTHGLNGNVDDWIIPMADRIPSHPSFTGGGFTCYEIFFQPAGNDYAVAQTRIGGNAPLDTASGQIFVKLDWRQLANNSYSTYEVADMVAPKLLDPNFIAELDGRALASYPLHLIGHSRGGSLVCELSRLLGSAGLWVDQVTTLDPHPLNNDGFFDFPYSVVDATAVTYENVYYADNYYQTLNLLFYGESVPGAYVRQLTNLDGGYSGLSAAHSDVHLWYHGTVDLATPATDSQAIITESERDAWFSAAESRGAQTGFIYSRLAGGNRFSASRPAGSGQGAIHDGINRRWDLGAGLANNRRTLALNEGQWANVVRLDFTATNPAPLNLPIPLIFYYQHEQPPAVTANVAFLLDVDGNPFNGNETQLAGQALEGTGVAGVRSIHRTLAIPASVVPGVYRLFALTDYGGRVRYQPADRLLTLSSPVVTPHLAALTREDGATILEVSGAPEQTLILETTTDFDVWTPLATNTLESEVWIFMDDTVSATGYKFYRAQVVGTDFAD